MTETTKIENSNDKIAFNSFNIQLGVAANLVKGYTPGWNPANGKLDILNRPTEQPMKPQIPEPSGKKGDWGYPVISLHETAESLITELLGYKVEAPAIDDAPPSLPAGSLLLSAPTGQKAKEALTETLGVSLEDTNLSYALVKLTRFDETLLHTTKEHGILTTVDALKPDPRIGVNADFMRSMARLHHFADTSTDLTQVDANAYLTQFSQYGTHFVSSISMGDQIIQVFAYDATRFAKVKEGFEKNNFSGSDAVRFQYYTANANTGRFGYVQQYGKIICLSNSPSFQESLNTGKWQEGFWAKNNSVFQIFSQDTKISRPWLNKNLTKQAPIELTLAPMTTFTEYKRATVWRQIFKAAMSTVFGDTINPNFQRQDNPDFSVLIPEDYPGFISTIATPTINIYKARLSLSEMQLTQPSEVKNFLTYGYVVACKSQKVVELPGNNVRLFGYILDMRASGQPNTISLSSDGFSGLAMSCDRFLGEARFQTLDGTKHFLVANGLRYDLDNEGWPSVTHDVRQSLNASDLSDLKNSIEFSLVFGESVIGIQTNNPDDNQIQPLVRGYLKWLGKSIPADTKDQDLLIMRFRALDLSNHTLNSGQGAFVPILLATEYENSVKNILDYIQEIQRQIGENNILIEQRKQAELINATAQTLNENIVESGKLLTGLIKANAQSSKDLSGYYDSVIKANEKKAKDQQNKINALSNAVFEQRAEIDKVVQEYKSALLTWETMEGVKFGLEVLPKLFSVYTAYQIPSSSISAVKDLSVSVQKIQKGMNLLDSVIKVYTSSADMGNNIKAEKNSLNNLENIDYSNIDGLGWEELPFQIDAVMSTAPNSAIVNGAKGNVVAAVKILVVRAKALAIAKSNMLNIQRDIYTTQCQKSLNQREANRLQKLGETLNPEKIKQLDKEDIDLVGFTGSLDYLRRQMFIILAKSFLLQDQALQYRWLKKPTPITSYSLLSLMSYRSKQSEEKIKAQEMLSKHQFSQTSPITINIKGVITDNVINGNAYEIFIDPNIAEFSQYVNLRVHSVIAEIVGVKSTRSGHLHVKLAFQNKPFSDRNINGEILYFHTPERERIYEFNLLNKKPNFTDNGLSWSDGVNPVTPFGAWLVSLPKTETNEQIVFSGTTVDIALTFTLKARIVDELNSHKRTRRETLVRPSEQRLIENMYSAGTVTNGWDVVFNMGLDTINKALRDQYDDLKNNTTYKNIINPEPTKNKVVEGVFSFQKFYMEYGYPLLTFEENNQTNVKLEMTIEKGTLTRCMKNKEDTERCDPEISISGKTLTAYVELSQISGVTSIGGKDHRILDINLNMEKGAFSINNIDMSDEEKIDLSRSIKAYFVSNKVNYLINRLNLTNIPVIDDMKPNGFRFKMLKTPAGVDILQLFIQTGNRPLLNSTQTFLNNMPEPLPKERETSLIVSSQRLFSRILPESLNKSNSTWRLEGCSSSNRNNAWWGKFTIAPISFNVDISNISTQSSSTAHVGGVSTPTTITTTTYSLKKNPIEINIEATLKPLKNGNIDFKFAKDIFVNYTQHDSDIIVPNPFGTNHPEKRDRDHRNSFFLKITGTVNIDILGSERNQTINMKMNNISPIVSGHLSGGGPSGTDDPSAKLNQQIKEQATQPMISQLNNVKFNAVSVFVLKNLLFPNNNYIEFKKAAVPGDMLILGNFSSIKDN